METSTVMSTNRVYNWKRQPEDVRDIRSTRHLKVSGEPLPESFELPLNIPIYDQGNLGSCVSNSGCACYRFESAQLTNNFEFDPSRLFLYYNTRVLEGTENEDSGAYIRDVFKALNRWGVCDEKFFPYDVSKFANKPSSAAYASGLKNIVVKYAFVEQQLTAIKQTLLSLAGVSFGFDVYSSFESGNWDTTTGIMPIPKPGERLLGGHACFTKDTKISLLDGREVTIEYLLEEYSDKTFYVYSYDIDANKIVPGLAHSPRKTGEMQRVLKVTLDNGEIIKCTENHPFLMRTGEYKEAKYLMGGDSLMPLYRKLDDRGYEMFLENKKWKYTHRYMVDWKAKISKYHTVVHHVDFNKRNNSPDNLRIMTWNDHTELHKTQTALLNEYAKSDRGRAKSRELMSALWADHVWRENRLRQNSINGKMVSKKLIEEGRFGTQSQSAEELSARGKKNIKFALEKSQTAESKKKRSDTIKRRMIEDLEFAENRRENGRKNFQKYNEMCRNGEIILTEEQKEKKRQTGIQNLKSITPEQRWLAQKRTTYKRFYVDKYATFDDYISDKYPNNHKVVSVEEFGYEDVYDITVEKHHNFALSSGVFVHNCTITGWSDTKGCFLVQNSWGEGWGLNGKFWMPYSYALDPNHADDFWCIDEIKVTSDDPVDPPSPEILSIAKALFPTGNDLWTVNKPTLLVLGKMLRAGVDPALSFKKNYNIVAPALGLNPRKSIWDRLASWIV